jgi:hypothetical protein
MNNETSESTELEVLPPSALEAAERASIDIQIATAHRFPRSMEVFKKNAIGMATIDEETAVSCIYRRPVGMKDGVQQFAEGMSVRMAEIVGASYGNLRVAAQIVEQTPRFIRARGMAHDLETNFAASSEVIESTVDKRGNPFSERMRVVVAKAALAKARRDATFQVVPRALAKPVEAQVRKVLMGDSKTIEQRRAAVLEWIGKLGIDAKRVWNALGIAGPGDLSVSALETLTGLRTAIKDNEVTIDEAFPAAEAPKTSGLADLVDKKPATSDQKPAGDTKGNLPEYTAADRDRVIGILEARILDGSTTQAAILKQAKADGIVAKDFGGELFELPTADLVRIAEKGGAK